MDPLDNCPPDPRRRLIENEDLLVSRPKNNEVIIKGKTLKDAFVIPRTAFRDNSTVWTINNENKLTIKKVKALRLEKERVVIGEGIDNGDMIILTNLSGAADGMKLRTAK